MAERASISALETVKSKLREISLAADEGAIVGSEDDLIALLDVSRSTLRQAARVMELHGFLRVRRGIGGGYFATRPDEKSLQAIVGAYLDTLDLKYEDVTDVASVLWVDVLTRAARLNTPQARCVAENPAPRHPFYQARRQLHRISRAEEASHTAIFDLVNSRYTQLIFQFNQAFSQGRFPLAAARDGTAEHREFVQTWRESKLLELRGIAESDVELAVMAARHTRSLFHRRFWSTKPAVRKWTAPSQTRWTMCAMPHLDKEPSG